MPKLKATVVSLALAAVLGMLVPATASSAEPNPDLIEVGPGIYIAAASDLPPIETFSTPEPAPTSTPHADAAASEYLDTPGTAAPYVVGGKKTSIKKWPWQVSIQYPSVAAGNSRMSHVCGGTLVAPNVVVTAAHCFNFGSTIYRPPDEYEVISGRTRLNSDGGQVHQLADYYYFTDEQGNALWNRDTIAWDVAFAVLATDSDQRTVPIAGMGEESVWTPGTRAFATGWGVTRESEDEDEVVSPSNVLRLAKVKMISDASCNDVYGAVFVPSLMVCAGERAGGVDVCSGDSGGPLVVRVQGGHRLVGNTSFADGCGLPQIPGVYGRLATDPIRGALANGVRAVTGADVLGSDASPGSGFTLRQVGRNRNRGSARVAVTVPSRGMVEVVRGGGVVGSTHFPREARRVTLKLRPRGRYANRLARVGRATFEAKIRFRPFNGDPRTKRIDVKFVKAV